MSTKYEQYIAKRENRISWLEICILDTPKQKLLELEHNNSRFNLYMYKRLDKRQYIIKDFSETEIEDFIRSVKSMKP